MLDLFFVAQYNLNTYLWPYFFIMVAHRLKVKGKKLNFLWRSVSQTRSFDTFVYYHGHDTRMYFHHFGNRNLRSRAQQGPNSSFFDLWFFLWIFDHVGPVAKIWCSAWLSETRTGPALWNYPAPPYSRRINTIRQKGSAWRVLPTFEYYLIIYIKTSRFGSILFINGYLRMEYTLFQDFT